MIILSFGEILFDIINKKAHLGGAPFNIASHLSKMGASSFIISSIGNDKLGKIILKKAKIIGINKNYIAIHKNRPTGTVDVNFSYKGSPEYIINKNTAWDEIHLKDNEIENILNTNWNVFTFGTLAQRTENNRNLLKSILNKINSKYIYFDINLRQNYFKKEWIEYSLMKCNILKMNNDELKQIAGLLDIKSDNNENISNFLNNKYKIPIICITQGENGAALYYKNSYISVNAEKIKTKDTIGAGDGFGAGFLYSLFLNSDPVKAIDFGCTIGSFIAKNHGAIPKYSKEIKNKIRKIRKNS